MLAAREAGLSEIPAQVHAWDEPLPPSEYSRYWIGQAEGFMATVRQEFYPFMETAKTWGDAVRFRSIEQRLRGFADFPLAGSAEPPIRQGLQPWR
ncbi:MAG: hypothetical protein KGR26_00715 [Cyanobacteria bacterium REEB65]|nr:hypothetical protein [Cyanobacteria bacterium REEB65]